MAESPGSAVANSASNGSESSGGFRSFWKRDKSITPHNVQFVPQDPGKQRTSRLEKLLGRAGGTSTEDVSTDGSKAAGEKRRKQVYQAQKRHRNRKAEYVQSLEAEIARLQHLDSMISSDKNSIAHQNEEIRAVLSAHSINTQLDVMNLSTSSEDLSMLGSAAVDIRYDPQIGHERVFMDFDMDFDDISDLMWTSSNTSQVGDSQERPRQQARHATVKGDSWAALDFILALEWPCRDHVKHHAINPNACVPKACDVGGFHGHALTTTKAVYASALPPSSASHEVAKISGSLAPMQNGLHPSTADHWQLPHSEIDKLVGLSEQLQLDDEQLTPAMAYSAIRKEVPTEGYLRPVLEALKVPLSSMAQCSGFGAWIPADMFYQHLDGALLELGQSKPL